ncbi:MAG: hypothetical protein ACLPYW_03180 [Acidimicrobiales bacterium]
MQRKIIASALVVVLGVLPVTASAAPRAAAKAARWTIMKTPTFAGGTYGQLDAISCPSAKSCFAVGYGGTESSSGSVEQPLIEHWDGTQWWQLAHPLYTKDPLVRLYSISCTSEAFCMAVGYAFNAKATASVTLAERWNGVNWSVVPSFNVGGSSYSFLKAVSCVSPLDCNAVGYSLSTEPAEALVEHYSGGSFGYEAVADVSHKIELTSISCIKTGFCEAAGIDTSSGELGYVASSVNGLSWTAHAALPDFTATGSGLTLQGISCMSATACMAVGYGSDGLKQTGVTERWTGTKWTLAKDANAKGSRFTALLSVTCAAANNCTAVGYDSQSSLSSTPAVEHWNGSSWSLVPSELMPIYPMSQFNGVVCNGTTCLASGYGSGPSSYAAAPLVERS